MVKKGGEEVGFSNEFVKKGGVSRRMVEDEFQARMSKRNRQD